MSLGEPLTAPDVAVYDSVVVPRYIGAFTQPAVATLIPFTPAVVAVLGCRTGAAAAAVLDGLPGATVCAIDNSPAALDVARSRLAGAHFYMSEGLPTPLHPGSCTNALAVHPSGVRGDYTDTFAELHRLLAPGGQMVVALPMRGSFPEIYDMLREYALRHEQPHFGELVEAAAHGRPNPETLGEQCERAGLDDVDVGVELLAVSFEDGRAFIQDPICRLVVTPDVRASLGEASLADQAMQYVADAVSKYWSEIDFDLTVNIGFVSARRPM